MKTAPITAEVYADRPQPFRRATHTHAALARASSSLASAPRGLAQVWQVPIGMWGTPFALGGNAGRAVVHPLEGAAPSREPPRGGSQHPTNQPLPPPLPNKPLANLCTPNPPSCPPNPSTPLSHPSSPVESKTRTHNGRVESARRTADGGVGRRWAEQGANISIALEANRPSGPPAQ